MANAWLRLWHDMPNDPKWRTIARVSGQPIATVMAVYIHLLVSASRNVTHMSRRVTTDTDKDTDKEDQNTMVHGVKNATNQAGDVQTVNPGQPAGSTPEADSAYALKADSGAVQQVMTARPEQSLQLQQPEADSAIQREADRVAPENTGQPVGRVDYPDVFEQVWREYPLRAGANPKKSAFSAWKARLREGVPPETMLDGVRRYARYLAATGKAGTEFVQRATTFFGPDRNFENPWLLPVSGTNNQRCVNHISEPDTEIPPGFRG
ncbi:phage replisome organizer [Shigella sonnei]|uniref:phage replisome organizer n=1 Tax=Shigella sonnei TaxID=624 RepID=UPI00080C7E3C|nr:phage replisome organizer [Shigella sonnei]EFD5199288.1 phage replisome organizer [Escherichia coli]EFH8279176.1 phage replisome organizer [Escherichia coli]EFH9727834.1 phage replisome organizer [Escherichia coli]EFP7264314.1 phage replisome organizer [Shigella sonnei]EFS6225872.1 phage replisome organizer [Shigella sonnei]